MNALAVNAFLRKVHLRVTARCPSGCIQQARERRRTRALLSKRVCKVLRRYETICVLIYVNVDPVKNLVCNSAKPTNNFDADVV